MMSESLFSASRHHIPPIPLWHFIPISPAVAEKVMQEPNFGMFLHHFLSTPRKAARIRGARRIRVAFKESEKRSTKTAALRASLSHSISRKERIDDEHHISPRSSSILIISSPLRPFPIDSHQHFVPLQNLPVHPIPRALDPGHQFISQVELILVIVGIPLVVVEHSGVSAVADLIFWRLLHF